MTDLKELAAALNYVSPVCNKLHDSEWRHEMARRIREREEFWKVKLGVMDNRRADAIVLAKQAESALLTCQEQVGNMVRWLEVNQPDVFSRGLWEAVGSRSTGSKEDK